MIARELREARQMLFEPKHLPAKRTQPLGDRRPHKKPRSSTGTQSSRVGNPLAVQIRLHIIHVPSIERRRDAVSSVGWALPTNELNVVGCAHPT